MARTPFHQKYTPSSGKTCNLHCDTNNQGLGRDFQEKQIDAKWNIKKIMRKLITLSVVVITY